MVVGFCFSSEMRSVVLIRKLKPLWQKGLLNGVGGKIEEGENSLQAMIREFKEEAGADIKDWLHFAEMAIVPPVVEEDEIPGVYIDVFATIGEPTIESKTAEPVGWCNVNEINQLQVVPNLKWLVPMAIDKLKNPNTFETCRLVYREQPYIKNEKN